MRLDFILRPAVELYSASAALLAAVWCVTAPQTLLLTPYSGWLLALALLALSALRLKQGVRILCFRRRVRHLPLWTLSASRIPLLPNALFLGRGFRWLPTHTQRLYLCRLPQCEHWLRTDRPSVSGGDPLLHGVELREGRVTLPLRDRPGHTLVLGTTRVGKTRLAKLLIAQDIRRGDTVIVFDPKGDADLLRRVWAEAYRAGRESVFWLFHLGWPEISARYNAVGRFGRISEVASCIAGQLSTEGNSAAFRYFGGCVKTVLVDNQKAEVLKNNNGKVVFNSGFLLLADHYNFLPRACRPRRARTKGKVERMVKYLKENFFVRYRRFDSFTHVNQQLEQWIADVADKRELRQFKETPEQRFALEQEHLQPLPDTDFDTSYFDIRHVSWDSYIEVGGNRYSVPGALCGQLVSIRIGSSDNGLPSAIPGAPDTETGIISGALARFSALATSCGHWRRDLNGMS